MDSRALQKVVPDKRKTRRGFSSKWRLVGWFAQMEALHLSLY
jgi:hypothetical protein